MSVLRLLSILLEEMAYLREYPCKTIMRDADMHEYIHRLAEVNLAKALKRSPANPRSRPPIHRDSKEDSDP